MADGYFAFGFLREAIYQELKVRGWLIVEPFQNFDSAVIAVGVPGAYGDQTEAAIDSRFEELLPKIKYVVLFRGMGFEGDYRCARMKAWRERCQKLQVEVRSFESEITLGITDKTLTMSETLRRLACALLDNAPSLTERAV